jgi:hypothetical protein
VLEHHQVEDELIERYVTGRLGEAERAAFEEHLVECAACLENTAWAEDFRGALGRAAAADPSLSASPAAVPGASSAPGRRPRWLPVAAALLGAALPTAAFMAGGRSRRDEVLRLEAESAGWQRQYEAERQRTAEDARRVAAELEAARQAASAEVNVPTAILSASRSDGLGSNRPVEIGIPAGCRFAVLLAELEPDSAYASYRGRIATSGGREVWSGADLRPLPGSLFSILLPASLLEAGDHVLLVEGLARDGRPSVIGRYAFRVVRPRG